MKYEKLEAMAIAVKCLPIMEGVYEATKNLDQVEFFCVLATVIDAWARRHKLTSEETFAILETLAESQKIVHLMENEE